MSALPSSAPSVMGPSRLRSLLVPVLASSLVALAGCSTWSQREVPAAPTPQLDGAHPVRLTLVDGSRWVLERPAVEGDSIVGEAGYPAKRYAFGPNEIVKLEQRHVSGPRTAGLVAGIVLGLIVVAAIAAAATATAVLNQLE